MEAQIVKEDHPSRLAGHKHFAPDEPALRSPSAFEITIEELVLHGFNSANRYAIAEAVESELTSLLTGAPNQPLPRQASRIERMNAGTFTVAANSPDRILGERVAQALYRSLAPPEANSRARRNKTTGKESGQR